MNSNTMFNTSDSGEEVECINIFLKGGNFTALWNAVVTLTDEEIMYKKKHG